MFALDLFNTDHERRLAEGAVDQLEQRRIDDLAMKMDDLVARAFKPTTTAEVKDALMKEFQKCKAERDSYFKIKEPKAECMGYGSVVGEETHEFKGAHGKLDVERTPGRTRVTRKEYPGSDEMRADRFPNKKLKGQGTGSAVKAGSGFSSTHGSMRKMPRLDHDANDVPNYEVDEAGIPGSVPTEKIPGKEALLKGQGRSYYEDEDQKKNSKEVNEDQRLAVGDPVIVTAPNEFEGKTGEIRELSPSGKFVIVDLYNHGKHSMHSSDVAYNQYADDQEEDDWYDEEEMDEGFQDFNKVEPYAVCLAGKPVKKFDYYEDARRFHDNWKKKLYREGNKDKADKITLMPLDLDEVYTPAPAKPFRNPPGFNKKRTAIGNRFADLNRAELANIQPSKGTPVPAKSFAQGIEKDLQKAMAKPKIQVKKNKGVAEGGAETSWSNDTGTITLQDILELTKHIKQINLPINDNLKSKLIHWEGNPEEIERVNQVTVSNQFPILIMVDEQGQIAWILDGNHRLHKAIQSQAKTIPAKLIKPSNLNDKAKKIFNIKEQGVAEGAGKQLSVQQLATISDAALDSAYGYGRSQPGNTFGWQANLKSAAFAKQMIDKGITDVESISDAIHKGWNVTAQAFVKNPMMFDDSKTMAPEKLQAKVAQRQKLMTQQYAQLPEDEKEKDRVVARAMLQAITGGQQGVTEAETDYSKRRQRERDVDAGRPVAKPRQPRMTDYQKRRAQQKREMELGESQDTSGVEQAILHRIMVAHTDLLRQFGPEKVMQAAEEVAYNVGDLDEIGTSDVSAWVHEVKRILGAE